MTHHCHWPGCKSTVSPSLWGCRDHWYALPKHIRDLIWANYKPGQEVTKTPSVGYIEASRLAHDWAVRYELRKKEQMDVLNEISALGQEIQPNPEDQIMKKNDEVREEIARELYNKFFYENGNRR